MESIASNAGTGLVSRDGRSGFSLKGWIAKPEFRAAAALALVILLGVWLNGNGAFYQWGTHRDMLRQVSVPGILAFGMTLVIVTGGIDLAVGSVLGLSAIVFSLLTLHRDWSAPAALALTLSVGVACGFASGGVISRFKVQPFIATLSMMVFARGLAKSLSGGQKISTAMQQADGNFVYKELPAIFGALDQKLFGGNVAVVSLIFLLCGVVTWVLLAKLKWGRYLYATGGNEEASRLSGVPIARTKLLAYGLSGFMGALAGICQAAQEQQGDPEAGTSYELSAIAMVVMGGTRLSGGQGGVGYTLMGVLTIGYLEKILSINAVPESSRLMLTGAIILAAVLLQKTKT